MVDVLNASHSQLMSNQNPIDILEKDTT